MDKTSEHPSVQIPHIIPAVIERGPHGERVYDIFSMLLKERIVFIGTPIDDFVADTVVAQLLYLDREDHEKEIALYINSPGGIVSAGLAIYDTMQLIEAPVSTVCVGMTASMGTVLLAAGTRGKRFALASSTIHLHQLIGGVHGQASDIEIGAKEILRLKAKIHEILVAHTGQPIERIRADTDRDFYLTPEQAKEYGLIDDILLKKSKKAK